MDEPRRKITENAIIGRGRRFSPSTKRSNRPVRACRNSVENCPSAAAWKAAVRAASASALGRNTSTVSVTTLRPDPNSAPKIAPINPTLPSSGHARRPSGGSGAR